MPSGITHCRRCPDRPEFASISELRQHQWAAHRELFANVFKAAHRKRKPNPPGWRKHIKKGLQRFHDARILAKANGDIERKWNKNGHGGMPVDELVKELRDQQKFLEETIALVVGLQTQYQEKHK